MFKIRIIIAKIMIKVGINIMPTEIKYMRTVCAMYNMR